MMEKCKLKEIMYKMGRKMKNVNKLKKSEKEELKITSWKCKKAIKHDDERSLDAFMKKMNIKHQKW